LFAELSVSPKPEKNNNSVSWHKRTKAIFYEKMGLSLILQ
jgi:hypothetical protein